MADIYIHTMPRSPLLITFHSTNMDKFNEFICVHIAYLASFNPHVPWCICLVVPAEYGLEDAEDE